MWRVITLFVQTQGWLVLSVGTWWHVKCYTSFYSNHMIINLISMNAYFWKLLIFAQEFIQWIYWIGLFALSKYFLNKVPKLHNVRTQMFYGIFSCEAAALHSINSLTHSPLRFLTNYLDLYLYIQVVIYQVYLWYILDIY